MGSTPFKEYERGEVLYRDYEDSFVVVELIEP